MAAQVGKRRGRASEGWHKTLTDRAEDAIFDRQRELLELGRQMAEHRVEVDSAIHKLWQKNLSWLEIALLYHRVVIMALENEFAERGPPIWRECMFDLGTRALAVANETLVLLRAGFPRGAHARWRTLYELAVVTRVVHIGGRWVASRYRNHFYIRAAEVEPDPQLVRKSKELTRRYGPKYRGRYGWAANLTKRKLGEPSPTFSHLVVLAEMEWLWPLYLKAHHDVHADAWGNAALFAMSGSRHGGPDPVDLGRISARTIECLMTVTMTMIDGWQQYGRADADRRLQSLYALGNEIRLTGIRWATHSQPRREDFEV